MRFTNDPKRIAANIRAERNRVNLSQEEVANRLGLTRRTYIIYEEDASAIKLSTLIRLSNIFRCDINAFYLP